MSNNLSIRNLWILCATISLFFLGACSPNLHAQTTSCIHVTTSDGTEIGVHSFNPLVTDPNGCVDSLNGNIGVLSGTNAPGNNVATISSNVTIVSQTIVNIDDEVHCRFHQILGSVVGKTSGSFTGVFDQSTGEPNFQGHAVVTVSLTDSNGSTAPVIMDHLCEPSGVGAGLFNHSQLGRIKALSASAKGVVARPNRFFASTQPAAFTKRSLLSWLAAC